MGLKGRWADIRKVMLAALPVLSIIFAGSSLLFTALQFQANAKVEAARFALQFDDRLTRPEIVAIVDAVENIPPKKVLQEHGGLSTDDSLDDLIGNYDTLYYLHRDGLIDDQLAYDIFCGNIEDVYDNPEVLAYVRGYRSGAQADRDAFIGFDRMAAKCKTWDASGRGHALAR